MVTDRLVFWGGITADEADRDVFGKSIRTKAHSAGFCAATTGARNLPRVRRRRNQRNPLDRIRRGHAAVQRSFADCFVSDRTHAGVAPVESTETSECRSRPGLEHRSFVY